MKEQPIFRNLRHALTWAFVEAEKQFTGYSNTASIIRHCKQKGAGSSTSPEDLSPQEQKAQAIWVLDTVRMALNEFEQALIVLKYGQGSINFADAFVQVGLEYPKYEAHVVDLILNIHLLYMAEQVLNLILYSLDFDLYYFLYYSLY